MSKFLLFSLLWYVLGNPFLAILAMLAIVYVLDRQFVGVFPSLTKPFKRIRNISRLKQQIAMSPSDTSSKYELARLLMERKKYREAGRILNDLVRPLDGSADFWIDLGTVKLQEQATEEGESMIRKGLEINPRAKYGQPYLILAEHYGNRDESKALSYLDRFREIHSSSCEAYYRMGDLLSRLGSKKEAREALDESFAVYRALPKYKKKTERKWVVKSFFKKLSL
ncbi:tetratricopeptide repeat protein [Paenibacillus gansuensis]|uniref:Tetratricopeptide repeat protein n=1 Tax=Paenibacillus gansuensis TaxID=306542 RepID=A0ABW5PBP8_9BACL